MSFIIIFCQEYLTWNKKQAVSSRGFHGGALRRDGEGPMVAPTLDEIVVMG